MTAMLETGVAQSTYRSCYMGELPSLPQIKYKTLPCYYPPGSTAPCREQVHRAHQRHVPAKRPKPQAPKPPALPVPSKIRPCSSKRTPVTPPTKSNKVFETKYGTMDMATIDKLYRKMRYTTFTQKAGAEFALPMHRPEPPKTTQEPKADMVRLYGRKYEDRPEEWQDAVLWDRIQVRTSDTPRTDAPVQDKLLHRRSLTHSLDQGRQHMIAQHVAQDNLAGVYSRKCPGYSGYMPLCPPETPLKEKKCPENMTSLMRASYTKYPDYVYCPESYARKGPFSKTLTLTYPFNPFNKVGEEITAVDKESKYSGMQDYIGFMPTRLA